MSYRASCGSADVDGDGVRRCRRRCWRARRASSWTEWRTNRAPGKSGTDRRKPSRGGPRASGRDGGERIRRNTVEGARTTATARIRRFAMRRCGRRVDASRMNPRSIPRAGRLLFALGRSRESALHSSPTVLRSTRTRRLVVFHVAWVVVFVVAGRWERFGDVLSRDVDPHDLRGALVERVDSNLPPAPADDPAVATASRVRTTDRSPPIAGFGFSIVRITATCSDPGMPGSSQSYTMTPVARRRRPRSPTRWRTRDSPIRARASPSRARTGTATGPSTLRGGAAASSRSFPGLARDGLASAPRPLGGAKDWACHAGHGGRMSSRSSSAR